MAIAFDNSTQFNCVGGGPYSQAFSMGTGSGGYLLVFLFTPNRTGTTVSSVTYNGLALLHAGTATCPGTNVTDCYAWDPANGAIPTGSHNITVTYSAQSHNETCKVVSYTGVDTTTPYGAFSSATATTNPLSLTIALGAGELAVIGGEDASTGGFSITITAGTERLNSDLGVDVSAVADATGGTVTYTGVFPGVDWTAGGVNLKPLAAPSAPSGSAALMMAGVGR